MTTIQMKGYPFKSRRATVAMDALIWQRFQCAELGPVKSRSADQEWVIVAGIVAGALVLVVGFGTFFQPVTAAVCVAGVAILIRATMLTVASIRGGVLSRPVGVAVFKSIVALASTALLVVYVYAFAWEGRSMAAVQTSLRSVTRDAASDDGILPWLISRTLEPAVRLFAEDPEMLVFCLIGMVGLVLTIVIDVIAIKSVGGWHAMLRLNTNKSTTARVTKPAEAFSEQSWKHDAWPVSLAAVGPAAILFGFMAYLGALESGAISEVLFGQ